MNPPNASPNSYLFPYPKKAAWFGNDLKISASVDLSVSDTLSAETAGLFQLTWDRFTPSKVPLSVLRDSAVQAHSLLLGVAGQIPDPVELEEGSHSALTVSEKGVAARGLSETDLIHSWFSMLQMLACGNTPTAEFWILPTMTMQDAARLAFRGIHICVFPETSLEFVEKIIKLAAFLKFSHIVIEFWGMLRLDSLKELAWPQAYTKAQIKPLLQTARQMGIQPVPMFNHWGHASGSRVRNGRHVVLDQNPSLEPLFEPDGWTWCLTNPASLSLLKDIRSELLDLFGKTDYFHLGCDEAYSHATCPECRKQDSPKLFANHLNSVNEDLKSRNIRPMIWGDALLDAEMFDGYSAKGNPDTRTHQAVDLISKDFIITDWQYHIKDKSKTAALDFFMSKGFEAMTAPALDGNNIITLAEIAIEKKAMGMLLTTWHALPTTIDFLVNAIGAMWGDGNNPIYKESRLPDLAAFVRKLRGRPAQFLHAGWRDCEVSDSSHL